MAAVTYQLVSRAEVPARWKHACAWTPPSVQPLEAHVVLELPDCAEARVWEKWYEEQKITDAVGVVISSEDQWERRRNEWLESQNMLKNKGKPKLIWALAHVHSSGSGRRQIESAEVKAG